MRPLKVNDKVIVKSQSFIRPLELNKVYTIKKIIEDYDGPSVLYTIMLTSTTTVDLNWLTHTFSKKD